MRLKELRKNNKKTQQEMAEFLNVSQTAYGTYELGTSEPTIETLCKLADFYGVSLDYLVGREFNNTFGYLSEKEKKIINLIRSDEK